MKLWVCFALVVFLGAASATNFNSAARSRLISEHNRARSDAVPPPATAMASMTWSSTAANQANNWANQCQYRHSYASGFGENIAAYGAHIVSSSGENAAVDFAFGGWEEEESGFAFDSQGNVVCTHEQTCGHYTQIVWADTTTVGCAYAQCTTNSPWGSAYPSWTFVVCNYVTPGNYVGRAPYVPRSGSPPPPPPPPASSPTRTPSRSASRPASRTPTRTSSPAPPASSPSRTPSRSESRPASRTPTRTPAAVAATPTRTPTRTPSRTRSRTPSRSTACNCGQNMQCVNNVCVCLTGYALVNGQCVLPTSGGTPSWSTDFSQIGVGGMTVPDTVLIQQSAGANLVRWDRSANVVNKYTTRHNVVVKATSGTFALAFRVGQSSTRTSDRVEFRWSNINGNTATMQWCIIYMGNPYCSNYGSRSFPSSTGLKLKSTMSYDDAAGNIVCTVVIGTTTYSGYTGGQFASQLGAIGYFFDAPSSGARPSISELALATSTTLTVSLTDCIDDSEWEQMFYDLTGASRSTTQVQVRSSGQNANCKATNAQGKALVSGFTFVVTSSSVPAQALASTFISTVGTEAGAAAGISSAGIVAGSEGAAAAGVPASTAALPGTVVGASAGGAGGGGGGGAGLSGGAIAGIVIGSVAGAVLLVGVTALIIGAVVVGAVVLTRGGDDTSASSSGGSRSSIRQTIRGFFGGVDVMNNPQGHQSITARSPAVV